MFFHSIYWIYCFFLSTPFIFHKYGQITQIQNALILTVIMVGMFIGAVLNLALQKISPYKKLIIASLLMVFSCIIMLTLIDSKYGNILTIIATFLFYTTGCQIVYPNSFSLGMALSQAISDDTTIANVIYSALGMLASGLITLSIFNTIEHSLYLVAFSLFLCSSVIFFISIILNSLHKASKEPFA